MDAAWNRLVEALLPHREEGVLVAFSGGLDSAVLLDAAVSALGPERAIAATAVSASLAKAELEDARATARELGATLVEVPTHELEDPGYVANAGDRCYFCKRELFSVLGPAAERVGARRVAYGYHRGDDLDHRPGLRAAIEAGALRPLWEAGLDKADLRRVALERGRRFADKASFACLSSRIPVGTPVSAERLAKVEAAEAWLRARGYRQFRARLDADDLVRLVTDPGDTPRLSAELADAGTRASFLASVSPLGITRVTVDLAGYRRAGEA